MKELKNKLKSNPVIYVTRDIERALGLDLDTPGYFIISNSTDFAKSIAAERVNIVLIETEEQLDTWELLKHPQVVDYMEPPRVNLWYQAIPSPPQAGWVLKLKIFLATSAEAFHTLIRSFDRIRPRPSATGKPVVFGRRRINSKQKPSILAFKNTPQIERTCQENHWNLLNPPAKLSNKVEEKISQLDWLGDLKKYLPEYAVDLCKNIQYKQKPFILQFNRSHTGSGTTLIESSEQLEEIKNKFPDREVRIAKYIDGPLFTNNNVVTNSGILIGNISYQITGLKPFTDRKFATIGNDWGVVKNILNDNQIEQYETIVREVGERLKRDGWQGAFGIDVVVDCSGKLYLVEINARQPASLSFESQLQLAAVSRKPEVGITTFEAHLAALLDLNLHNYSLTKINDGAQIIRRKITNYQLPITNIKNFENEGFNVIEYNNTKPESDLLRIQSTKSIMKAHNKFNEIGQKIIHILNQ